MAKFITSGGLKIMKSMKNGGMKGKPMGTKKMMKN